MQRIIGVLCSFGIIALMLSADRLENSSVSYLGSLIWMLAILLGIALIYWQASRTRVSPFICVVAFIPYFNLILIPIVSIILAILPSKKSKNKKAKSKLT